MKDSSSLSNISVLFHGGLIQRAFLNLIIYQLGHWSRKDRVVNFSIRDVIYYVMLCQVRLNCFSHGS